MSRNGWQVSPEYAYLKSGNITDEIFEQLSDALERIIAKVLAGIFVSQKSNISILYDTKEYTPFISTNLTPDIENLKFDYSKENSIYNLMMNSLTKWETPTIRDKVHFFNVIEESYEFEKLKLAMKHVENFFKELIENNSEIVTKKLKMEFIKLEKLYKEEIEKSKKKFKEKASWHIIEMIAGQFLGFLTPWISDSKELREKKINEMIKNKLLNYNSLNSELFYISELWNKVEPKSLEAKINSINIDYKREEIWGENKNYLPWYEQY